MDNGPTLSEFLDTYLQISLEEFGKIEGVAPTTLRSRWNSKSGRYPLKCQIFARMARRFWG